MTDSTLYVTLEPCAMCLGAMMHARIARIVYGANDQKTGACGSSENLINANCFNHKIHLISGILEDECKQLLKKFFNLRRLIYYITKCIKYCIFLKLIDLIDQLYFYLYH